MGWFALQAPTEGTLKPARFADGVEIPPGTEEGERDRQHVLVAHEERESQHLSV